jgi:hypothetical protein
MDHVYTRTLPNFQCLIIGRVEPLILTRLSEFVEVWLSVLDFLSESLFETAKISSQFFSVMDINSLFSWPLYIPLLETIPTSRIIYR